MPNMFGPVVKENENDASEPEVHEIGPDDSAADVDEKVMLLGYWRFDGGQGEVVADVTDHKADIRLGDEDFWRDQVPEDVLDTEDMWGKTAQPTYGVNLAQVKDKRF